MKPKKRLSRAKEALKKVVGEQDRQAQKRLDLAYEAAYYIEHGKLNETLELLTNKKFLIKKRFISGVVTGLVSAVGLVIALGIFTAILGTIGQQSDGAFGDWARSVNQDLKSKGSQAK